MDGWNDQAMHPGHLLFSGRLPASLGERLMLLQFIVPGIELDENYYNISKKRIEEALHIVCE